MSTSGNEATFTVRPYGDPVIGALIEALQQEYVRRYGEPDLGAIDGSEFDLPSGLLVTLECSGLTVAMGGWRIFEPGIAELKRMFVVEHACGQGLSRLLLGELERRAVHAGFRRMILNTGQEQPEAVALYESSGYTPTAGFGHYADAELALFYGKDLDRGDPGLDRK